MRDILFKGKSIESDEWVEGSLTVRGDEYAIYYQKPKHNDLWVDDVIDPKTRCQQVKPGMWEGDVFEIRMNGDDALIEVQNAILEWSDEAYGFGFHLLGGHSSIEWIGLNSKDLIGQKHLGNIHDNPELL